MSYRITQLAERTGRALQKASSTLATAESCTGGGLAEAVTRVPGSSAWFERGWVTYSNLAKEEELGVPAALLVEHGAVSEAVVRAMADGARHKAGSGWAIAVSGIAGPDGGTAAKPVGTVWIAWAGPAGIFTERYLFNGSREAVRTASIEKALYGLIERVELATRQAAM